MNADQQIKAYQVLEAKAKYDRANYEAIFAYNQLRPCYNVPVTVKREGSRWVCLLESSRDLLECPVAYGDSPHQALHNFDQLWLGTGLRIADHSHDDEDDDDFPDEFGYVDEDDDEDDDREFEEEF